MNLSVLPSMMVVLKLIHTEPIPPWAYNSKELLSITYTNEELSIVCSEESVPDNIQNIKINSGWKCIKVEGPLDFSLTGILSSLTSPLAKAKISIFAISTYDTDYLLVKSDALEPALQILSNNGHSIIG